MTTEETNLSKCGKAIEDSKERLLTLLELLYFVLDKKERYTKEKLCTELILKVTDLLCLLEDYDVQEIKSKTERTNILSVKKSIEGGKK